MAGLLKALFVEDEQDIRFIVEVALQRQEEFSLTSYPSGLEALNAMTDTTNSFDFALINVHLPAMSGIEFLRRLRNLPTFETLPAILVTASIFPRDLIGIDEAGVIGVITKPFDAVSLGDQIRKMLSSRQVRVAHDI